MGVESGLEATAVLWDIGKIVFGGALGYGGKLLLGEQQASVRRIKEVLAKLADMGRQAEQVMRSIIGGNPDHPSSYMVVTDRQTLRDLVISAFGTNPNFQRIEVELNRFTRSLEYADPAFGGTTPASIAAMRDAERDLRAAIQTVASKGLSWRFLKHGKDSA